MKKREPLKEGQKIKFVGGTRIHASNLTGTWKSSPTKATLAADEQKDGACAIIIDERGSTHLIHRRQVTTIIKEQSSARITVASIEIAWDATVATVGDFGRAGNSAMFEDFMSHLKMKRIKP